MAESAETTTTTTSVEPETTTTSTTVDLNLDQPKSDAPGAHQAPSEDTKDDIQTDTAETTVTAGASVAPANPSDLASHHRSPVLGDEGQTQDDRLAEARETAVENAAVGGLDADVDPSDKTRV